MRLTTDELRAVCEKYPGCEVAVEAHGMDYRVIMVTTASRRIMRLVAVVDGSVAERITKKEVSDSSVKGKKNRKGGVLCATLRAAIRLMI